MKHFVSPHQFLICQPDQSQRKGWPAAYLPHRAMQIEKAAQILNRNRKEKFTTREVEEIKAFLESYSKIIIHNMLNEN